MSDSPPPARGYSSKLRTRQKEQTGELILSSVAALLNRGGLAAVTIAAVAQQAEVTERTIYRHFATREDLLGAFWQWQLQQAAGENVTAPPTLEALLATIPRLFASLDANEGVVRAMLSSPEGRALRLATNRGRVAHMNGFLAGLLPGLDAAARENLAAGIVVVSSVMSWMFMRDHCGFDGPRAGAAAADAVRGMIAAAQAGTLPQD